MLYLLGRAKLIQGPAVDFEALEITGRKTGDFFELIRQVPNTAVSQTSGDFAECQLIVNEQLLYPFYPDKKNTTSLDVDEFQNSSQYRDVAHRA